MGPAKPSVDRRPSICKAKKSRISPVLAILLTSTLMISACSRTGGENAADSATNLSPEQLEAAREWQRTRTDALLADDGWLNLVGLYWLEPGENSLGSDPRADIVLPDLESLAELPSLLGSLTLETDSEKKAGDTGLKSRVVLTLLPDVALAEPPLSGEEDGMVVFETGQPPVPFRLSPSVEAVVIERGGFHGLRLRDRSIVPADAFAGFEMFPPESQWIVEARFEPFESPRQIPFPNQTELEYPQTSSGELVFELAGQSHRVSVLGNDPTTPLFLVLGDQTNGVETYSGGRFVYSDPPRADGTVRVDFNRLYNPPCVFTSWATCPLPPPQNKLPIRIEAGEKLYRGAVH